MKLYQLGLYEKAMPNHLTIHEKLVITKETGFDFMELSIDETDEKLSRLDMSNDQIKSIIHAMEETNTFIQSICLSGHRKYPLGSLDEEKSKKSLEIMEKAILFAHQLGVRYIQIAGYDTYYDESNEKTKEQFLINLKKSVTYASTYGVILAFETMETKFMNTITKAMHYVSLLDSPYLKVYPDIGNLTNAYNAKYEDVVQDINDGKGHIVAAHLKETKPGHFRNLMFGEGHTNYESSIKALVHQGVRLFVGEFWYLDNHDWKENIIKANQFLRHEIERVIINGND